MKKVKSEILAPAGNIESFYAAINAGADAIYLGLQDYNARGNIDNFNLENIESVINYAHLFDVKIYMTFNTLIKNEEMEDVLKIIQKMYEYGADAFIIQDLGLAVNIKKFLPDAEIHASTQMGIHSLEGVKFLEKVGFSRVVLSRETPLEEIKRIHDNSKIEIEYFIQGALCVSFSGNCYLCSLLTGNSGNRGKCQQFCRLPYEVSCKNGKEEGYLLSAKDFCMLPKLKDLYETGVTSFKIEGRARRPGYVSQVVQTYRKVLDDNFEYNEKDIENLKKVFNRGDYTCGYFDDNKIIDSNIQGHKGILIGKVEDVNFGKKFNIIKIKSKKEIHIGDGLKFVKNEKEKGSIGVGDVKKENGKYIITTTSKIETGCDVYLTLDAENEKENLQIKRKLKIDIEFIGEKNKKGKLIFKYKNNVVEVESEKEFEEAINQPISEENIINQISKLNDTVFEINNYKIKIDKIFINKSEINNMRRKCVEKLINKIINNYKNKKIINKIELNIKKEKIKNNDEIIKINNLNILEKINIKNNKIIYSPLNYLFNDINKFAEYCLNNNINGYLDLPIFATEKEIEFYKLILKNNNMLGIVANNYYSLELLDKEKIIIGMGLNVFNNYSLNYFEKQGYQNCILSKEIKIDEINEFNSKINIYYFAKGRDEYMLFKRCPFKELFNSKCNNCKYCDNLIYKMQNGKELLLERKKIINCQFNLKSKDEKNIMEKIKIGKIIEI